MITRHSQGGTVPVEATVVLGEECFFEDPPAPKVADVCATFYNGSTYIARRRGVSEAACGAGYHVFFPTEAEAELMGCSNVAGWAGYVCRSDNEDYLMRAGCPTWDATLDCNLRNEEPCHPHPIDTGCFQGLLPPSLAPAYTNETCAHACPRGYQLDANVVFEPTCDTAGLILPPPPCIKQCSQQIAVPPGSSGFSFDCPEVPTTERVACNVVPSAWSRVCNTEAVTCEDDLRSVSCPHHECLADSAGVGVSRNAPAGSAFTPVCPDGLHPTVNRVVCTLKGWSHSNICRPTRPPRIRVTRSECINGYYMHRTSVLDNGFPPVKFGMLAGTRKVPCADKCCEAGGLSASVSNRAGSCRCELERFQYTIDGASPRNCCVPPDSWGDMSRYVWRERHEFRSQAVSAPCAGVPCTETECSGNSNGCLGFNVTHLFLREAVSLESAETVAVVQNAVILEYIFT